MPKISVITPSYNQAQFLERTIGSVLSQPVDLEYIIMDACSSDGSAEILERYRSRARVIIEKDKGQADAIAKGFALATGDILAWLNSDDMYVPGALSKVVAAYEAGHEFVYGNVNIIDAMDNVLRKRVTIPVDFNDLYYGIYILPQEATFFSRRLYEECGGVNPEYHYAMDYDLWLRMARIRNPVRMDEVFSCFRFHEAQKSRRVDLYEREVMRARASLKGGGVDGKPQRLRRLSLGCRKFLANVRDAGIQRTLMEIHRKQIGSLP
ncbi:glycosyltransferase family 2 protein [Geobacter sp. DSM 9736]|uniref:glycosyltransferase family 2 protein n=1 Tax=Geobacter sp. DSM 9736 TaxID=1277350 RepID=UPI000B5068B3|nr:glycosyltransferase family 2 protein [Geobacter sp. DSM 9736]SNB46130.1 Glycosyltransferase involved in cell wall bisynthesis [Geobacter sp. DSM 9736]